jgi:hypothetical protein
MLQEFFGAALICMSALTVYARVMARSAELRRPSASPLCQVDPHPGLTDLHPL